MVPFFKGPTMDLIKWPVIAGSHSFFQLKTLPIKVHQYLCVGEFERHGTPKFHYASNLSLQFHFLWKLRTKFMSFFVVVGFEVYELLSQVWITTHTLSYNFSHHIIQPIETHTHLMLNICEPHHSPPRHLLLTCNPNKVELRTVRFCRIFWSLNFLQLHSKT